MSVADLPYSIMGVAWVGLFYLETTGVPSSNEAKPLTQKYLRWFGDWAA